MIFNFAERRSRKKMGKRTRQEQTSAASFAPSPEGEGCDTHIADAVGAPVAFGPVYAPLSDMEVGGRGVLGEFDMPESIAEQLMNLGLVPGLEVMVAQSGPGGDPRVYRVDGVEVALRGELAKLIAVTPTAQTVAERTMSLRDKGATLTLMEARKKRSTLRCAKDGAPRDVEGPATVGLSTQEASAD
jgi:ferrous iron transport protein A